MPVRVNNTGQMEQLLWCCRRELLILSSIGQIFLKGWRKVTYRKKTFQPQVMIAHEEHLHFWRIHWFHKESSLL